MARERILITVKTYPTLSRKYGETVCTAGLREDGSWVRIYPVPFRRLEETEKYRKYDRLECDLVRHRKDPRPESHYPADTTQLVRVAHLDTADEWRERRRILLGKVTVYRRLQPLIDGAKANQMSLALFKPTRITGFVCEPEERQWSETKLTEMRNRADQGEMFEAASWRKTFEVIPKLPYSFSYQFEDDAGKASEMQILDWEIGALYWNCVKSCHGDEAAALAKVRQQYFEQFRKKDLHFFFGTTQEFHFRAPNPWVIIGVLPIPHEEQRLLL